MSVPQSVVDAAFEAWLDSGNMPAREAMRAAIEKALAQPMTDIKSLIERLRSSA